MTTPRTPTTTPATRSPDGPARPVVNLVVDDDGDAVAILGRCRAAARRAGWTDAEVEKFTTEATAGTYDALLATVLRHFEEGDVDDA